MQNLEEIESSLFNGAKYKLITAKGMEKMVQSHVGYNKPFICYQYFSTG